ncbi:hypothetical protein QCA50_017536 [Cerrena zonata]|uniref:Uncharacterized protein n=1 Tax=Cerrena zonata TaxID=2478898 RepID=A0AAW0FQE2_9APHY
MCPHPSLIDVEEGLSAYLSSKESWSVGTWKGESRLKAIPQDARERVDNEVSDGRCLIENVSPFRAVDYVHCYARKHKTEENLLTTLEWHWGMKYTHLNLDTRYNIFRAGASLHRMLDGDQWMLVPAEPDVITAFLNSLEKYRNRKWIPVRAKFPQFEPHTQFEYQFIPISKRMEEITISRQNSDKTPKQPSDVTVHIYPFTTISVKSHLHPKFVILEAGRKMHKLVKLMKLGGKYLRKNMVKEWVDDIRTAWPVVEKIERIYEAWMYRPNFGHIHEDPDFNPPYKPNDPDDDHRSIRTTRSNVTQPQKSKKRRRQEGSPTRQTRSQTGGAGPSRQHNHADAHSNTCSLSRRALRDLDEDVGKRIWTKKAIALWSAESAANGTEVEGLSL